MSDILGSNGRYSRRRSFAEYSYVYAPDAVLWLLVTFLAFLATQVKAESGGVDESRQRAVALLRGVVARLSACESVDVELTIVSRQPDSEMAMSKQHFRIQQSRRRRRCEQLKDSSEPSVYITDFDADIVYGFIRSDPTTVDILSNEYADKHRGVPDFDPRTLGITSVMTHMLTLEQSVLLHVHGASIELLDPVEDANAEIERVRVTQGEYSSEYWISEPSFRVIKRIVSFGRNSGVTVSSEFDNSIAGGVLPATVLIQDRQPGNYADRVIKLLHGQINQPVSDDAFSLASIGIPVNAMLTDYRKNQIVGYWTGRDVAESPVSGDNSPKAANNPVVEQKPARTWLLVANGAILCVIVIVIIRSYRASQRR